MIIINDFSYQNNWIEIDFHVEDVFHFKKKMNKMSELSSLFSSSSNLNHTLFFGAEYHEKSMSK